MPHNNTNETATADKKSRVLGQPTEQRFKQLVALARWSQQDMAQIEEEETAIAETDDKEQFLIFGVRQLLHNLHGRE